MVDLSDAYLENLFNQIVRQLYFVFVEIRHGSMSRINFMLRRE